MHLSGAYTSHAQQSEENEHVVSTVTLYTKPYAFLMNSTYLTVQSVKGSNTALWRPHQDRLSNESTSHMRAVTSNSATHHHPSRLHRLGQHSCNESGGTSHLAFASEVCVCFAHVWLLGQQTGSAEGSMAH